MTRDTVTHPGKIAAGRNSNEIVHIIDWFTTLLTMAGLQVPSDRVIDGRDQSPFLFGGQEKSNRNWVPLLERQKLYGVKWQNFKLVLVEQKYLTDPALPLGFPHIVNLVADPKEREPFNQVYLHTWTMAHFGRLMKEFETSVQREPLITAGAPLDFLPKANA